MEKLYLIATVLVAIALGGACKSSNNTAQPNDVQKATTPKKDVPTTQKQNSNQTKTVPPTVPAKPSEPHESGEEDNADEEDDEDDEPEETDEPIDDEEQYE